MKEPLWGVQSFTLNIHIIRTLNHQLFEQDIRTLNTPIDYLKCPLSCI